jgi:hypothetical protein
MAGGFFVIAAVWYVAVLRRRLLRGEAGVPGARDAETVPVLAEPAT